MSYFLEKYFCYFENLKGINRRAITLKRYYDMLSIIHKLRFAIFCE
ncbi:hypothetical protein LSO9J_120022 [Candidatus Liberibacter solanacearum]